MQHSRQACEARMAVTHAFVECRREKKTNFFGRLVLCTLAVYSRANLLTARFLLKSQGNLFALVCWTSYDMHCIGDALKSSIQTSEMC